MSTSPVTLSAMTVPRADFAARVDAAAAAGFAGIGLTAEQYRGARAAGWTDAAMLALLTERGLRVTEVEASWDWGSDGTADRRLGADVFHVLETFGVDRFNAVEFAGRDRPEVVRSFAALCERAAGHGVTVALEFMPFSRLPGLGDAWDVVSAAAADNGGILIDTWHYRRSPGSARALAAVPPERIVAVQVNDAAPVAMDDARYEARHHRLLPGEQAAGVLRTLRDHGVDSPIAVEVWSDELAALPAAQVAALAHRATRWAIERSAEPPAVQSAERT